MKNIHSIDKKIQEAKLDLIEVKAYRALQSSHSSEDSYYEMEEQNIEDYLEELLHTKEIMINNINNNINDYDRNTLKKRPNRYLRKKIILQKYKKLSKNLYKSWYAIYYNEDKQRYIRIYNSKCRQYAHKQSEKKIRKSNDFKLNGSSFKKVYDFWWEID